MSPGAGAIAGSRLRRLAQEHGAAPEQDQERCELCGAPIPEAHRHMLVLSSHELLCVCRACGVLFDREGAGNGRCKLLPERRLRLNGFRLSDLAWERLQIPVGMAFFFDSSAEKRVIACYPGPMGPVESQLRLDSWRELEEANPVLEEMQQDVEALIVNRVEGARRHWLVPLDDCYALAGLIRTRWRGLGGGREVRQEIDGFFDALDRRARDVREGR